MYLTVFKCLTVSACVCRERVKRQRLRCKRRASPISTFFAGRWILTTGVLKKVRVKYPYNKATCSTFCPACCFLDLSVGLFFLFVWSVKSILKKSFQFCILSTVIFCGFLFVPANTFNLFWFVRCARTHAFPYSHKDDNIYIQTQSGLATHKNCRVTLIFVLVSLLLSTWFYWTWQCNKNRFGQLLTIILSFLKILFFSRAGQISRRCCCMGILCQQYFVHWNCKEWCATKSLLPG